MVTGPIDDHTCGERNPAEPCECFLPHGHRGQHACSQGCIW